MPFKNYLTTLITLLILLFDVNAQNQETAFVYGDKLPDAPALSSRGDYKVGVKTLHLINPKQIDVLNKRFKIVERRISAHQCLPSIHMHK